MPRFVFSLVLALAGALPAAATTTVTDYEDVWYAAPAESQPGWGVNIAQQGEVMFTSLFVYGPDNTPRWYAATLRSAGSNTTFSGDLFTVGTGTYFAAPWAGASSPQTVGTMTFTFDSATTGAMTYTVGGATVSKNIVRMTWNSDVLTGTYIGGVTGQGPAPACRPRVPGTLTVTHTPPSIAMTLDFNVAPNAGRCSYQGTYAQTGNVGSITGGSYHCDVNGAANAVTGTFTVDEIRATRNGWNGRIAVISPQCNYTGYIGGLKDSF
jgi:hypothetical protein